jgi:hypothetical protein
LVHLAAVSPLLVTEHSRISKMRHEKFIADSPYRLVDAPADLPAGLAGQTAFQSAAAVPDVPKAVGKMIITAFVALLTTFAVTLTGSRESLFAIAICAVFLFMFFAVPTLFLRTEPGRGPQPDLDSFMDKGMMTYTGPVSGRDALIQMLIVPVLLTATALIMGIVALAQP